MRIAFTWIAAIGLSYAQGQSLQMAVDRSMAGHAGTAVVLDVETGRLLARHRLDIAARRVVAPGSAVKPFTLVALVKAGIVNANTSLICRRTVRVRGRRVDCSHVSVPEPMNAENALAYSCNYFFAHFAERLTDSDLKSAFEEAGLESATGLADNELMGQIRSSSSADDRRLQALGEFGVEVTPIGLAAAYRRVALNFRRNASESQAWQLLREALQAVTTYGTGRLAAPERVTVAGKTGTSGGHAWFAGYAPADHPEVVVVVFLERGSGGGDAAPIAGKIFSALNR